MELYIRFWIVDDFKFEPEWSYKALKIQFSQNFGTVNFKNLTLDNFAVQFCIHQTATHAGGTRFNAIHWSVKRDYLNYIFLIWIFHTSV